MSLLSQGEYLRRIHMQLGVILAVLIAILGCMVVSVVVGG